MAGTDNISNVGPIDVVDHHNGLLYDIPPPVQRNESGKPLHEVFNKDTQEVTEKDKKPSWAEWIASWIPFVGQTQTANVIDSAKSPTEVQNVGSVTQKKLLDPTPALDAPLYDDEENDTTLSPFSGTTNEPPLKEKIRLKQAAEVIASMSDYTMDQIISIIMKAQLELEKEGAITVQSGFLKLQDLKKIHARTIEEVKDALAKDENIHSGFKKASNIAQIASGVFGFISMGLVIAATGGFAVPAALAYAATVGTMSAATLAVVAHGGKSYAETSLNQNKGKLAELSHERKKNNDSLAGHADVIEQIADAQSGYEQVLLDRLKSRQNVTQQILSK